MNRHIRRSASPSSIPRQQPPLHHRDTHNGPGHGVKGLQALSAPAGRYSECPTSRIRALTLSLPVGHPLLCLPPASWHSLSGSHPGEHRQRLVLSRLHYLTLSGALVVDAAEMEYAVDDDTVQLLVVSLAEELGV